MNGPAVARSRSLLLVAALAALGARCELLPALVSSDPADGAGGVARSAWITLRFAEAIPDGAFDVSVLLCGGELRPHSKQRVSADTLVVNPQGSLPAGVSCALGFETVAGPHVVRFHVSPAGPAFTATYDRRDRNAPLPFPDDFFLVPDAQTRTGLRVSVSVPNRTRNVEGVLGGLARSASALDGWSPIGNLTVQLSAAPDPATLPLDPEGSLDPLATVGLFDLTPGSDGFGERVPFELTVRADRIGTQPVAHSLMIFPGVPLTPRGRYALVVTKRVRALSGEPLGGSSFFAEVVAPLPPAPDATLARAHPIAQEVLDALEALDPLPIPRDDVALAVRLSVRSTDDIPDDILVMREQILAEPASFEIEDVQPTGLGGALVSGTFEVPVWVVGPFIQRDGEGRPSVAGTASLPFVLAMPPEAAAGGAPIVMYQHGNPGSAETEVPGNYLVQRGFAVAGFTDVLNRQFVNFDEQLLAIFGVVLAFGDVAEFFVQTYAEQLAFLHVLRSLGDLDLLPIGAPDGVPDLDPSVLSYEGISNGSNNGQGFLAWAPEIEAAGLVVGAQRLTEILEYQDRTGALGGAFFLGTVPGFVAGVTPPDLWMGLALFGSVFDRQDPHNHAAFLYRHPLEVGGTTKRASILVVEGVGDCFIPGNASRSLAWTLGPIPHLEPVSVPVSYLPVASPPLQGNVDPATTAAYVQIGDDPAPFLCDDFAHFDGQTDPGSQALRTGLYRSALEGTPILDW
jgi:hypothetical protein